MHPVRDRALAGPLEGPYNEQIWDRLRQGARNVAGIRYQLATTAYILAASRARQLPFAELVPEGLEDIDCVDHSGNRWFIQVKEVGAGAGTMTASGVADVINHAATAAPHGSRFVALTDARFSNQLRDTGWERTIVQTSGIDLDCVVTALTKRGRSRSDAEDLVARTHLVRMPWNLAQHIAQMVVATYKLAPAVAALVVSRLLEDLAEVTSDQRYASAASPRRRSPTDLDSLVERTVSIVDIDSLERAVRDGVCEIADYVSKPGAELGRYLRGIDATPAHIGADFDVRRPGALLEIQIALKEARYVLISGPSGAGKSTQMWRSARDAAPGAQVIRVRRLESHSDLEELIRYIHVLAPSDASTVVVCCDDVGRPSTALWQLASRRLLEIPGVLLLGAVRYEELSSSMLGNGGVLVDLQLDRTEALDIALRLQDAGVSLALQPEEAILSADGHLMEYIALLTTGERMRAVLAAQAESLLVLPDDTAANVARAVCSGHALGLSIDAVELPKLAQVAGPLLTNALRRLQDEHIVVSDEGTQWRGLHQRRSDMLVEFLHKTPPPAIGGTLTAVLCAVQPDAVGWALRRTVEVFGDVAWDLTKVARHAATRCQNANELAILLEGLERADYALTAFRYIPALQRHRPQGLSLLNLAHLVCAYKFNGFSLGGGGGSFSGLDQRVRTIANELPDSIAIYREAASEALSESLIVDFICKADLEEAVRLLEVPSLMRASILPFPPILVFGFGRFRPCRYRSRPSSVLRPSRASMLSPKHLLHALQTAL